MRPAFQDRGFVIRSSASSYRNRVIEFYTRSHGKIRALCPSAGSKQETVAGTDLFSFHDIEYTDFLPGADALFKQPTLIPVHALNSVRMDYPGFLFSHVWCEILSRTEADTEDNRLYGLSEHTRRRLIQGQNTSLQNNPNNQTGLIDHARALFDYLRLTGFLFAYDNCGACGRQTYRTNDAGGEVYNKSCYDFTSDGALVCGRCRPEAVRLDSAFIRLCRILDRLPAEYPENADNPPEHMPEVPAEYISAFIRQLLTYLKISPGLQLKSADAYLAVLNL